MKLRLRPWLVLVFVALVVPVFGTVLAFNFFTAERVARDAASGLVERALHDTGARTRELIDPMRTMVRAAAGLAAAHGEFLRSSAGVAYLTDMLAHGEWVTGVFAGFSDGGFRGVLRVSADVRVQGIAPPQGARLARLSADGDTAAEPGLLVEFVDEGGRVMQAVRAQSDFDPRVRPWFSASRAAGALNLSDPYRFASTNEIGLTVAAPFGGGGANAGVVGADITLATLRRHMADRRASPNSESLLVDERGRLLAHTLLHTVEATPDLIGGIESLANRVGERVATALVRGRLAPGQLFFMDDLSPGGPIAAMTLPLLGTLGKPWEVLVMAPLPDFSGALHENNRRILLLGIAALAAQLVVILWLSGAMAGPLERLAARIDRIREFPRLISAAEQSRLHEIDSLGQAVATLQSTVSSFGAYVPRTLVQKLVDTGQALTLGGESRYLTLMFTDLEGFSALSERTPSQTLLRQVSAYHGLVASIVESQHGTVDKFIGDGALAFWGAPLPVRDHAWHACEAALRLQQGLSEFNLRWQSEGLEPLRLRIGIHCDSVLVGNIGSEERMSYTVLGDGVNVAAYIETANKTFGTSILISQAVVREAGHRLRYRPLEAVSVKNRQSSILVYELLGTDPDVAPGEPPGNGGPVNRRTA